MNLYLTIDEDLQKHLKYIMGDEGGSVSYTFHKSMNDENWSVFVDVEITKTWSHPDGWKIDSLYIPTSERFFNEEDKNIEMEKIHEKAKSFYTDKLYSDEEVNQIVREIINLV